MLALGPLRQLFVSRRAYEQDTRSIKEVCDAASQRLGEPRQPAVVKNFVANGVKWAWQLAELNQSNWDALRVPIGLQTAMRAELAHPTIDTIAEVEPAGELDKRKRRFLLMPDADGQPAKPLGEFSVMFLSLLTIPVAERQHLMLVLCELLVIISGLFLSILLSFRRSTPAPAAAKGWDVAPTLEDYMDTLMLVVFLCDCVISLMSVMLALTIAASGYHADDKFCEGAMSLIAALFLSFVCCVGTPLSFLAPWHVFTDAASPYAAIGGMIFWWLFYQMFLALFYKFGLEHLALEQYHMPLHHKTQLTLLAPWLRPLVADKVLRPKAEIRAAKLRAQLGATYGAQPESPWGA